MVALSNPPLQSALRTCVSALRKIADYKLPDVLDRRLLQLGENKSSLRPEERDELLALLEFTQKRTLEKLEAELALRELTRLVPELEEQP